jgi:hypothetical protein
LPQVPLTGARYPLGPAPARNSHGAFDIPGNLRFSPDDLKSINGIAYVTTADGALTVYDSNTERDEVISVDLPSDPASGSYRRNRIDAALGPKNEPTFGFSDWIDLLTEW